MPGKPSFPNLQPAYQQPASCRRISNRRLSPSLYRMPSHASITGIINFSRFSGNEGKREILLYIRTEPGTKISLRPHISAESQPLVQAFFFRAFFPPAPVCCAPRPLHTCQTRTNKIKPVIQVSFPQKGRKKILLFAASSICFSPGKMSEEQNIIASCCSPPSVQKAVGKSKDRSYTLHVLKSTLLRLQFALK